MRRRGQDLRRDERHALDLDEIVDQDRPAIAPEQLVVVLVLGDLVPLVHPLGQFLGPVQVIVDLVRADPLRDRALVDAQDLVSAAVLLEDLLAGVDDHLVVPVVDPQQHPFAGLQVPAGVQALIVGAVRHHLEIGQQVVGALDLDIGRTARRHLAQQRWRIELGEPVSGVGRGGLVHSAFLPEHLAVAYCMQLGDFRPPESNPIRENAFILHAICVFSRSIRPIKIPSWRTSSRRRHCVCAS